MSEQQTINLTPTQLQEAIGAAYTKSGNEHKVVDLTLADAIIESIFELYGTKQQAEAKEASSPERYEYDDSWQFGQFYGYARTERVYPFSSNPNKYRIGNVALTIGPGDGHTFFVETEVAWLPKEAAFDKLRELYRDLIARWAEELQFESAKV